MKKYNLQEEEDEEVYSGCGSMRNGALKLYSCCCALVVVGWGQKQKKSVYTVWCVSCVTFGAADEVNRSEEGEIE